MVEHLVSCFLRILRNLWVELDTILEHSFLLRIREVKLVIVSKQAHWLGLDRSVSALLRSGSNREAHCFYLKSYKFFKPIPAPLFKAGAKLEYQNSAQF